MGAGACLGHCTNSGHYGFGFFGILADSSLGKPVDSSATAKVSAGLLLATEGADAAFQQEQPPEPDQK